MANFKPTPVPYATVYKKATEMEKIIQDLQCKANILFDHRDKESKIEKVKAKILKERQSRLKKESNLRNANNNQLLKNTNNNTRTNSKNRSNSSRVSSNSKPSQNSQQPNSNKSNLKKKASTKNPTKKESKTSNYSKKSNIPSTKKSRALSPTIITPVINTNRSKSPNRKLENSRKKNKSSPSEPNVNATKPITYKRPISASQCLTSLVNHAMKQPSTVKFVQNVTKNVIKKTSSQYIRNRTLNKTLSLPMNNNHKINDLYHPYLLAADQLCFIRETVDRAISQKKTFTVVGNYHCVRRALEQRGWIEKLRISYNTYDQENLRKLQAMSIPELLNKVNDRKMGASHKRMIMSKLLARHQVDLYWDQNIEAFKHNPDKIKYTLINMIKRGAMSYSSKLGLCESLKRAHWYQVPNYCCFNHPRSYSLTNNGDPDEFVKDFKLTAAISMLKWTLTIYGNSQYKLISDYGKIPINMFHFAITECTKFLRKKQHQDIDIKIEDTTDLEWNQFLDHYYKAVHIGSHFKTNNLETEDSMAHKSRIILDKLKIVSPNIDMDGWMNIWILKPIHGSRGIGIYICRTLQYVLKVITENKNSRYVIQKYIERPLLIYDTKFDIRQWFLISSTTPITIWMYKHCYLRFSSQTYNLRKLHESIHLTNNSVQCRYKNCNRDSAVPSYNMWDTKQFRSYLTDIGQPDVFNNKIYPGMKQCIIAAVLMNAEYITPRKNCFELYGADFMLTENFQPWLIEINSRPALHPSTPVTAKMCKEVLEDVIKVVVDYPKSSTAQTGLFEMIHKDRVEQLPIIDAKELKLEGAPLRSNKYFTDKIDGKSLLNLNSIQTFNLNDTKNYLSYVSREMKDSLLKLLNIIQGEKERRRQNRGENKKQDRLHGKKETDDGKFDKINRNTTNLMDIFTQTLHDDDGKELETNLKKNYFCIKKELEELFVNNKTLDDSTSKVCTKTTSQNTLSTTCSVYLTPKLSLDKFMDEYEENKRYVFKDVYALVESKKLIA